MIHTHTYTCTRTHVHIYTLARDTRSHTRTQCCTEHRETQLVNTTLSVYLCARACARAYIAYIACARTHMMCGAGQRKREERLPLQMFERLLLPLEHTFCPSCGCAVPRTRCRSASDFFLPRPFTTMCPAPPDAAGARDAVSSGRTGPATRPAHRAMLLGVPP